MPLKKIGNTRNQLCVWSGKTSTNTYLHFILFPDPPKRNLFSFDHSQERVTANRQVTPSSDTQELPAPLTSPATITDSPYMSESTPGDTWAESHPPPSFLLRHPPSPVPRATRRRRNASLPAFMAPDGDWNGGHGEGNTFKHD